MESERHGAERLLPGLERLAARTPTLPPATHTNSYALGEREVLLVEPATPYPDEQASWLAWAEGLRAEGRRLTGILVTHHHIDHAGGAALLSERLGVPLLAHRATAERLPSVGFGRLLSDGEELLLDGETPQRWQVLHTPGHAPGHLCLHEPDLGVVVVGDMVASQGTILIEPGDGDMREYLAQLRRLEALGARLALPAHGAPITEPAGLFRMYIRHRGMREAKVLSALRRFQDAGATAEELLPLVYDDTAQHLWPLALWTLRAHLVKLVAEARVREEEGRHWALGADAVGEAGA